MKCCKRDSALDNGMVVLGTEKDKKPFDIGVGAVDFSEHRRVGLGKCLIGERFEACDGDGSRIAGPHASQVLYG